MRKFLSVLSTLAILGLGLAMCAMCIAVVASASGPALQGDAVSAVFAVIFALAGTFVAVTTGALGWLYMEDSVYAVLRHTIWRGAYRRYRALTAQGEQAWVLIRAIDSPINELYNKHPQDSRCLLRPTDDRSERVRDLELLQHRLSMRSHVLRMEAEDLRLRYNF